MFEKAKRCSGAVSQMLKWNPSPHFCGFTGSVLLCFTQHHCSNTVTSIPQSIQSAPTIKSAMQGKLTTTKKIVKLKDIPPYYYYYLSTGAKPPSTQVSSALLHLQLSSEKQTPLFTEILYAHTQCLCGYMKL